MFDAPSPSASSDSAASTVALEGPTGAGSDDDGDMTAGGDTWARPAPNRNVRARMSARPMLHKFHTLAVTPNHAADGPFPEEEDWSDGGGSIGTNEDGLDLDSEEEELVYGAAPSAAVSARALAFHVRSSDYGSGVTDTVGDLPPIHVHESSVNLFLKRKGLRAMRSLPT